MLPLIFGSSCKSSILDDASGGFAHTKGRLVVSIDEMLCQRAGQEHLEAT